jgi:hypothetical protein
MLAATIKKIDDIPFDDDAHDECASWHACCHNMEGKCDAHDERD